MTEPIQTRAHILPTDPRLIAFLEALPRAQPNDFCSPPGLGGVWRVRHVRHGLDKEILVIHHSGKGLAYAAFPTTHGACKECSGKRAVCDHCACLTCAFDRLTAEHNSPRVSREKVDRLRAKMLAFTFTRQPQIPALDADWSD